MFMGVGWEVGRGAGQHAEGALRLLLRWALLAAFGAGQSPALTSPLPIPQPAPPCPRPHYRSEGGLRHLAPLPLRSLVLSACCQLTDSCLRTIAESLPGLQCLGLYEAGEDVTDEGLAALAPLGASLTALDLGYSCWSHTAAGLAALLERMPRLQMLNIGEFLLPCGVAWVLCRRSNLTQRLLGDLKGKSLPATGPACQPAGLSHPICALPLLRRRWLRGHHGRCGCSCGQPLP